MTKKPQITEEDKAAFQEAVRGVKRITQTKIIPPHQTAKTRPRQARQDEPDATQFVFSDYEKLEIVGSEDTLEFSRPGLQHKILRKLRLGQYNIEATLDLHGQTVEGARQTLSRFLLRCQKAGIRHVLIIHGKGHGMSKPILKNKLNHWLRQTEEVLAFCSAAAKDGRGGALYVLLRRI